MGKRKKHNNPIRTTRPNGGIRPDKSLGQNFLIDDEVIQSIIDGSDIDKDSLVIEIGPGEGALTCQMAELAGRVVAVELDDRLIPILNVKLFSYGNCEVIHGDILEVDLNSIIARNLEEYNLKTVRVVGNLPYYITTPIIMKLLEMGTKADSITAMMQKEVGDRLYAEPGSKQSGAITYAVHYYSDVRKVVDVGRECFYPAPKVESVVLRMDILKEKPVAVKDEDFYFRAIKAGFTQRRKTLLNSLTTLDGFSRETIAEALERSGIESNRRAESLSMQEFAILADMLMEAKR